MSDAIVRLRVESQEYDNKLKRATDGLTRYADECRKVGGTLSVVEQETLDYVKALGQMDTVSRTATGSLAEMKKTYTELSVQYKKLTDEEKESPFGKALAESLNQLKGRIQEAKGNLDDVNKSMTGGGGLGSALDSIAGKFGLNIKQLTGWGAALAAGKVALDVAKDAFFASEATVDEWGRTVAASESVYQGFLNAINTGDISGYLNRIDDIVKAARIAYDELDRLGTMQRIQSPQKSAQQTENERMRMMIQTGRYIAPVDGRSNAVFNGRVMQNGDKLTAGQIRAIERQLQGGLQKTTKLIENEVKQTTRAISALYDRQSKELGLSRKEFMAGTSSMAEFDKRIAGYQKYKDWNAKAAAEFAKQGGRGYVNLDKENPYAEYKKWGTFRVDGDRYNQLVQLVLQRDQQAAQAYSMQGQTYRAINRAEGFNVRQLLGGGGGTGGGGGNTPVPVEIKNFDPSAAASAGERGVDTMPSIFGMLKDSGAAGINGAMGSIVPDLSADIEKQQTLVDELREKWAETKGEVSDGYLGQLLSAEDRLSMLKESQSISTGDGRKPYDLGKDISTQWTVDNKGQLVKKDEKKKEDTKDVNLLKEVGSITSGVSGIFSGIEQLGIELPKDLKDVLGGIQGVITILSGIATIVTAIQAISAADAIIPFARGGIVPRAAGGYMVGGNQFSGDNVFAGHAWVNSGELILNRSQQNTLAGILDNKQGGGGNGYARVSGEQIYLAINNYLSRSGKGELVTWR